MTEWLKFRAKTQGGFVPLLLRPADIDSFEGNTAGDRVHIQRGAGGFEVIATVDEVAEALEKCGADCPMSATEIAERVTNFGPNAKDLPSLDRAPFVLPVGKYWETEK